MNDPLSIHDAILDLCINAIYDQGKTVDDCLAQYPESKAVEPILRLAEQLQSARRLSAPADFRLVTRDRLEQQLPVHPRSLRQPGSFWPVEKPAPNGHLPSRRTAARTRQPTAGQAVPHRAAPRSTWASAIGVALIILLLLVSTTNVYASNALPGEPLYGVKIASEKVQLALAPSDAQNASLHLQFAGERFREMRALIEREKTPHLRDAVQSYQAEINTVNSYLASPKMAEQDKTRVLRQLSQQIVDNNQQLSMLLTDLPKAHPDVPAATVVLIQSETQPAVQFMHQMFPMLRDMILENKDLMKEFQGFPGLESPTEPVVKERTATPVPLATLTIFLPTSLPGVILTEGGETEWPTSVTTARPTQWPTDWATLFPVTTVTPLPPSFLIQTLFPTYPPTRTPTQRPANPNGNTPDDQFPGWQWPTDFPDDNDKEPTPGWVQPPNPPGNDQQPPSCGPTEAPGDDNEAPPGWDWPTDFPDDGGDDPGSGWQIPPEPPGGGEVPPPGWGAP